MTAARPVQPPKPDAAVLREGLGIVWSGMRQEKRMITIAVIGAALWAAATVATSMAIGYITENIITPAATSGDVTGAALWSIVGLLGAILVANALGVILRRVWAVKAGFNLQASYRRRVTRQYLRLPLTWHHRHPSGQLLSNAHADIEATWMVFNPLPMAIGVIFMLAIAGTQMFFVDPTLAFIGLLVFPLLFAANLVFQRYMSPRVTAAQQLRAQVSEVAHESFEAGLVVKALGREREESARFDAATYALRDSMIRVGRTRGVFEPVIEAIPTLGTLAVLGVGTARVANGDLVAADVVEIAYLFSILAFPVRALGWVLAELPRTVVGHRRVSSVLQAQGSMEYGDVALAASGPARSESRNIEFGYQEYAAPEELGSRAATAEEPGDVVPAIRGVHLDIPAGSTTALVGPTGSGKSTLSNIVVRLVDPDAGVVSLDGLDLRSIEQGGVTDAVALVAQQTFMFDGTVRDNVDLGLGMSDDEVSRALAIAHADEFVEQLPDGMDTEIGERGGSLSGGQRQRVALARAVARSPRMLVLDDATSAVDPKIEQDILASLRDSASGTTVLVIAYRMATVRLADRIVYMEDGAIQDEGSHEELMGRCTGYADLVSAYAREAAARAAIAADEEESHG